MTEQQIKDFIKEQIIKYVTGAEGISEETLDKDLKDYKANLEKQEMLEQHDYKPLPYFLEILDSPIEGQGLFLVNADGFLFKDGTIGVSHFLKENGELFRTPLGGFINHSDNPNCKLEWDENVASLVVAIQVEPGEELTLDYSNELCGIDETDGEWTTDCTLEPYIEQGVLDKETCCKQNPCTVTDKTGEMKPISFYVNDKLSTKQEFLKAEKKGVDRTIMFYCSLEELEYELSKD